jgi:hypothetical protein
MWIGEDAQDGAFPWWRRHLDSVSVRPSAFDVSDVEFLRTISEQTLVSA